MRNSLEKCNSNLLNYTEKKLPTDLGEEGNSSKILFFLKTYRFNAYFMVLDIITNEMENRFQENDSDILGALLDLLNSEKPNKSYELAVTMYKLDIKCLKAKVNIFSKYVLKFRMHKFF